MSFLRRTKLRTLDLLRVSNFSRFRALLMLPMACFKSPLGQLRAIEDYLITRHGGTLSKLLLSRAHRIADTAWPKLSAESDRPVKINRSIILKRPLENGERGVLLTSFESELNKLVLSPHFPAIEREYQIVFLPTWQPFFSVPLFFLAAKATEDFFVMPSARADDVLVPELGPKAFCLPFQASSWISRRMYESPPEKEIDLIMVANFAAYKRHWRLFEALADLPEDLRVVLTGRPLDGRTRETLMSEAALFGVQDRFELIENPSDQKLSDMLASSRLFLGLSNKEGSYIAVGEALMAGTPVGLYANAKIGSKSYVNEDTGILFDPAKSLASQINSFLSRPEPPQPQRWAMEHIAAEVNCQQFERLLREHSETHELKWSRGLETFFCKHFEFFYDGGPETETEYADLYDDFAKKYEIVLGRPDPASVTAVHEESRSEKSNLTNI